MSLLNVREIECLLSAALVYIVAKKKTPMLDSILTVLILSCRYVVDSTDPPVGHLKPIGRHRPPMASIEERGSFPTPQEMFEKYVKASKPVIFRGILEKGMLPAYKLWTDDYLR